MYRARQSLEHRYQMDLLRITELEKQLAEAQVVAEVADKRYDEVKHLSLRVLHAF